MSQVRFIGCLHFGHEWMAKHRGFQDSYYHDEHLIDYWNRTVHKKDLTYILGDITMEKPDFYYKLTMLNGRKKVILGNHDKGKHIPELLKYVETVEGMEHYKGYWLTHCPVHPQELTFVHGNIHAHIHEMSIPESNIHVKYWDAERDIISASGKGYYNVDAKLIDFKPKTIEELIQ